MIWIRFSNAIVIAFTNFQAGSAQKIPGRIRFRNFQMQSLLRLSIFSKVCRKISQARLVTELMKSSVHRKGTGQKIIISVRRIDEITLHLPGNDDNRSLQKKCWCNVAKIISSLLPPSLRASSPASLPPSLLLPCWYPPPTGKGYIFSYFLY